MSYKLKFCEMGTYMRRANAIKCVYWILCCQQMPCYILSSGDVASRSLPTSESAAVPSDIHPECTETRTNCDQKNIPFCLPCIVCLFYPDLLIVRLVFAVRLEQKYKTYPHLYLTLLCPNLPWRFFNCFRSTRYRTSS